MKVVVIQLLVSIICSVVGASIIQSPFTKDTFTYDNVNYEIVEGDMRVAKGTSKSGIRDPARLWPQRIIPYKINNTFTSTEISYLMRAIGSFYEKTCIKFVPAMPRHKRYVSISNQEEGCWSDLGYYATGAQNQVNFGYGCLRNKATPVHELLHTCGLAHEHNRADRDEWVKINWDNIENKEKYNFEKSSAKDESDYGVPYNYDSVMHYPLNAFAKKPGLLSMENLKPHSGKFGYEIGWAESDIQLLHLMYNCTYRDII